MRKMNLGKGVRLLEFSSGMFYGLSRDGAPSNFHQGQGRVLDSFQVKTMGRCVAASMLGGCLATRG